MYIICLELNVGEGIVRLKQAGMHATGTLMCCPEGLWCADYRATKCAHTDL